MVGNRYNVELHIKELVLHGFAPGDRFAITKAVELELTRLLAEQGVPLPLTRERNITQLDAGAFDVTPDAGADAIGTEVARAVYARLE
jgi:hypothetical protein